MDGRARPRESSFRCAEHGLPLRHEIDTRDGELVDLIYPCRLCVRGRFVLKPAPAPDPAITKAESQRLYRRRKQSGARTLPARPCRRCHHDFEPPAGVTGRPNPYCPSCRAEGAPAQR